MEAEAGAADGVAPKEFVMDVGIRAVEFAKTPAPFALPYE